MGGKDAAFVRGVTGADALPFLYLGAKHMVTGYDHLLFLLGVVFYLKRARDIVLLVSLFSLGHSITLIAGTLLGTGATPFLVDAAIGLSVAYKGFDNLAGFPAFLGRQPDNRIVVFAFGLVHGLGLATGVERLNPRPEGLIANLLSFNAGVEIGQMIALAVALLVLALIRKTPARARFAVAANWLLIAAGTVLTGYQLTGYFLENA